MPIEQQVSDENRGRDRTSEQREREAFVLLLHSANVADAHVDRNVAEQRLARDLVFSEPRVAELAEFLERSRPAPGSVRVTPKGLEYLERAAGLRSSVRPSSPTRLLRFRP
jgi:hypothetical protein